MFITFNVIRIKYIIVIICFYCYGNIGIKQTKIKIKFKIFLENEMGFNENIKKTILGNRKLLILLTSVYRTLNKKQTSIN